MYILYESYRLINAGVRRVQKREVDPGIGYTGGCEPPIMGAGFQTQVLCRNSTHLLWLILLLCLPPNFY